MAFSSDKWLEVHRVQFYVGLPKVPHNHEHLQTILIQPPKLRAFFIENHASCSPGAPTGDKTRPFTLGHT